MKELQYVFAGKAIFTLESKQTGRRYTYKITKSKTGDYYFANLMFGNNNETDYRYIGLLTEDGLVVTKGSHHPNDSYPVNALNYFMKCTKVDSFPPSLGIYHSTRCCHCGKLLTTPESIEKGIGPECEKIIGLR